MPNRLAVALALLPIALAHADAPPFPDEAALRKATARFAPVEITANIDRLPPTEKAALGKLVAAARLMDGLFLRQAWAGNESLLLELVADQSPLGRARLHAFLVDKGPWIRLDHNAPFLPGVPPKPPGGSFYPAGATKPEIEAWLKTLPDAERARATGFFTTVRRATDGKFVVVPYSVEYQPELAEVASLLRQAAALTAQPSLRTFLTRRAAALLSNDYYDSDVAWMELDASVDATIGPYEVYEDDWFNAKAAFEAFIAVRDDEETRKLQRFSAELQGIEDRLPLDPKLRNPKIGALAPIRVVNLVFAAGDGNHGVQTAAFNLPNDERIAKEKGTKRVMLKNVQEAKFQRVLLPIARVALAPADQGSVSFDAFFTHILMHELMHGLGPHNISASGRATTVRQEFQDTYSALEEAKADISGLMALQQLVDKGVLDRSLEKTMYVTFLVSTFRAIRFGLDEAHGKGIALQLNYLLDAGAFRVAADGTFSVDPKKARKATVDLTREILTLQAAGDRTRARALLARLAVVRPEVRRVLDRLRDVPVDIEPRFTTAAALR